MNSFTNLTSVRHLTVKASSNLRPKFLHFVVRNYAFLSLFILCGFSLIEESQAQVTTVFSYTGANQNFTVPPSVTSMQVYVYGAGGGSGGCVSGGSDQAGGGGGGGACAIKNLTVSPGQVYTITIGAGGAAGAAGGAGGIGGTTTITGASTITADGGGGGGGAATNGAAGIAGPAATTGTGYTTIYSGGNGSPGYRNASSETGGAGGGGAGNAGAGGNGTGSVGSNSAGGSGGTGTPTNASPYKGAAGTGATNTTGTSAGVPGSAPGGGAAGAASYTATAVGAQGGAGQVIIIYTISCTPPSTQAVIGSFTSNTGTGVTANWTRGNGTGGVLVVARLTATTAVNPINGSSYTANPQFGAGTATGAGNFVVYNGTGTSASVIGLSSGTSYTFTVYEYNSSGPCFLTPGSSGAVTTVTLPAVLVPASGNNSVNCGTNSTLYDNGGSAGNYSNNNSGYTVLNSTTGSSSVITLTGTYSTESTYDFLKIYSGVGTGGTLLASYTGAGTIATITSAPGTAITVQFTSDGSTVSSGFALDAGYSGSCLPFPTITSTSPLSACIGQSITITGTNFTNPITSVTFGGVAATTFAYVNATTVTATVPAGAASGSIVVTQSSGSGTSTFLFGVTSIPAPTATNSGTICSGSTATLTASGLTPGGTVANFTGTTGTSAAITTVSNNFTMDFWVKPGAAITINAPATSGTTGLSGQQFAVCPTQSGTNGGVGVSVGTNGISVYEHGNGYISPLLSYTYPATITTFTHIAVVYISRTPSLYLNGTKVATGLTSVFGTNSYPSIGSDGPGGANYGPFTGILDDYRLWNGSLTQAEIVSIMFNQNGTTSKTKLAQYTFNNSTVTDAVGGNPNWNTPSSFVAPNYFTYTWTGTNAPSASTAETQTTGALTSSQSYTVVATVGGSCPSPSSAATTVTVNPKSADPTSATASATTICNGGTTSLTLNGGGGGTGELVKWYAGGCGGTFVGTNNGFSVSPTVTTTYYGRYEDPAPCSYNSLCASVTITVNQKSANPTVAAASATTICNGQPTILTLTGGGGGTGEIITWYSGSCGGTLVGTNNNLSVSPTTTTTYYGRYEDPSPCSYNTLCAAVTVTVNQKSANPATALAAPATICNGQASTLSLVGGGGGTGEIIRWYTASCGGVFVGIGNNLSVSPPTTTTYYGRYEDGAPCNYNSLCASVTVTVNQKSADPTSASVSATTICNGQATNLTLNGGGGGGVAEVIHWYSGSCGGTPVGTGNNLSVSPTTTTTYYGRYEDGAPCNYNSLCASVTVTVNQKSTDPATASASATTICNGQATSLSLNGGGGGTAEVIHWYSGSCGGTPLGTGNNFSVNPTTTTTYYGRYEDGAPCNYNSLCASVTVTVNQKSADPASALASATTICTGDATVLTLNGGGGGTGETVHWYSGSCGGTSVGTGNNLSVSPAATTTYYGRYEDGAPCNYNSLCASVTITVNPNYTITASAGANGSISPNGATTFSCFGTGSQTYTITAAACYAIADVLVDGVSNAAAIASGSYTFSNVSANHTISATFVKTTFTITATSGANGTVTPAGNSSINCGDNATYTITPDAGYSIADVQVDGGSVGAVGTYTFTNVTANHTISATFAINTYMITATAGANGSIAPNGVTTVNSGDNQTYTITAAACYSIADVLVDGQSVGALATYSFTNVTANHTISATFTLNTYTITATSGANGTLTPAGATTVNCGDNATYTITPAACYAIADVLVDGQSVGALGTYTFTNVTANHTISATFTLNTYTITATSGANGTVTPAGPSTVNCGANATYTITPAACYSIASVLVDGQSVGAVGTYTFTNVTANHTISATFVKTTFTITATSGANGTVTPAGNSSINCGDNATYTITPDAGYSIADVQVDGGSVGAVGTYTFTNVTANHTISATFAINTYTITATAGANGSIAPNGVTTVNSGDNQTYTITAAACYSIADVLVDGQSVGALATYSFTNVTANHTISATFTLNTYTITATSGANGTVTPTGATAVNCGDNATYTITPAACYSIADVLVDGQSVGALSTYTFTNVTANHTISATFVQTTYTITATSGANGSVTPTGATAVNCGDNATYTITPAACYAIATLVVDGVSVTPAATYTFTNVTANHTISATFTLNNYTITATSGANGTVTPAGASTVNCGSNATYTITPAACYSIADVLMDGQSVGALATYTFTNVTANHTISATFTLNTYTITATSGANGSVTPAGASTVNCGDDATYTITAAACYSIADVLVDGQSVGALGTYSFTNVTANHTISATFTLNTYTITATSGANGTVTPAGANTVNCGDNATYTITAAACYSIADVLVDGQSVGALATYTFTNVTTNHTISATFTLNTYTITATSGANGSVTPAGTSTVNCGDNATYTITPAACYSIADVLVDGQSVGALGNYSFTNVTANHAISATFVQTTYIITATSGANGSVTPTGASTVNCGDNATYTVTPAACYAIADVLVDGQSVGALGTYTFTNVTANHTISATFIQTTYTITASADTGGSVTPSGASTVICGNNATYTIAANSCFSITNVVVDGISQGAIATYTFTGVSANHTISATFTQVTYVITVSSGANGNITPGTGAVNCGANATYTITPAACYHVADVLVDGTSAGAVTSYTFTNVTSNHTISATFAANGPAATPVVTGVVNVCPYINNGSQITYTAVSQGATGFTWVTPPNVTIVSGQGTANLTVTFQAAFLNQANKQLRVTATSPCGNSSQIIYYLRAEAPVTPQPIIASSSEICPIIGTAGTITYKIPSVVGATSYLWSNPAGTNISHPNGTGINDTLITLSFTNAFATSALTVRAANDSCGASGLRSLTITRANPSQPGLISGPTNACPYMAPGGTAASYSIAPVTGATSYTWTAPGGAVITGQGTTMISFTYPSSFTSGSVTVTATNGCGTSTIRSLAISKLLPAAPSAIDVIALAPCPDRVYSYTLSAMPANSTSVQWTVPAGGTITSGQGTTSITVSYSTAAINGNITAQALSNCGSSSIRVSTVKLPSCAIERPAYTQMKGGVVEAKTMSVNVYPNPSVSDFNLQVLTAGKEAINVRILDLQGREYRHFTVQPNQTTTLGSDLKAGAYMMEVKQGAEVKTSRLIKF